MQDQTRAGDITLHGDIAVQTRPAAAPARVKVLNPLTTTSPSIHAELLSSSEANLRVRVPRSISVGSAVQVKTRERVAFGLVRSSTASGSEYEIGVDVQRSS